MSDTPRAELLQEAKLLEEMGGEWLPRHAAAFANVSQSFLRRSGCPKLFKRGERGVTGKHAIAYLPADVRHWNALRTIERVA